MGIGPAGMYRQNRTLFLETARHWTKNFASRRNVPNATNSTVQVRDSCRRSWFRKLFDRALRLGRPGHGNEALENATLEKRYWPVDARSSSDGVALVKHSRVLE